MLNVKSKMLNVKSKMLNVKSKMLNVKGYTFVELLIVITILGLLSVTSFVYWKSLSSDRVLLRSIDNIQTLIRTAQSNATSGFSCAGEAGATTWSIKFNDSDTISLICKNNVVKNLIFENVNIDAIKGVGALCTGSADCGSIIDFSPPITISFAPLNGKVQISGGEGSCLSSATSLIIKLKSANTDAFKCFTVSNGGAINVQ